MKYPICVIALSLTAACGGSGGGSSDLDVDQIPQIAVSEAPSQTFTGMLNGVRASNGSGAVAYDSRLGTAARRHANDMHANSFLSHTGSDGSTIGSRVTDAGYSWNTVGENIAQGQQDEAAVLAAWMNSTGHRENNVNPNFEDFALAKAGSGSSQYWVLVLARER